MRYFLPFIASLAGLLLLLANEAQAEVPTSQMMGPPIPGNLAAAPAPSTTSLAHPAPPNILGIEPASNDESSTPVLAPAPDNRSTTGVGSVTCFACPEGEDYYHGSICMNGIACAAEGVTLQQLKIGIGGKNDISVTSALRQLESARAALAKSDSKSRSKALDYINKAVSELKTAGLKAACPARVKSKKR